MQRARSAQGEAEVMMRADTAEGAGPPKEMTKPLRNVPAY